MSEHKFYVYMSLIKILRPRVMEKGKQFPLINFYEEMLNAISQLSYKQYTEYYIKWVELYEHKKEQPYNRMAA